jgi:hypothetical protein
MNERHEELKLRTSRLALAILKAWEKGSASARARMEKALSNRLHDLRLPVKDGRGRPRFRPRMQRMSFLRSPLYLAYLSFGI